MCRLRYFLLACLFCISSPVHAQDKDKVMRSIYEVRFGNAKHLAEVLGMHCRAEGAFQAVPEATSNSILLSGTADILVEARNVLEKLDRAPRQVQLQLWIAEVAPGKGSKVPAKSLTGTIEEVSGRLEELHHKGHVSKLRRYEMKASENQQASTMHGAEKAFATGVFGGLGGGAGKRTTSVSFRSMGIVIKATPRIAAGSDILLELMMEDSRPQSSEDGPVIGQDDAGNPLRATEFLKCTVEARLCLRSGHATMVEGVVTRSKLGTAQTVIVVGAQVLGK